MKFRHHRPSTAIAFLSTILSSLFILTTFLTTLVTPSRASAQTLKLDLERYGRIHNGVPGARLSIDIRDPEIYSPKSVRFAADGTKLYINSLEGSQTVVYSWPDLRKLRTISHRFTADDAALFQGEDSVFGYRYYRGSKSGNNNIFSGKPVESELSHGGRYLWIPYYRRDFDTYGQSPGAVAIVDTRDDRILRVMPTGPIPKYVVASPDGRYVAIIHWGDNTIGLIDTSAADPRDFRYVSHLKVESQLSQADKANTDRDKTCGFCLRGSVFTPDSQHLLVARMGQGGIAGFHVPTGRYLGTVMNVKSTPRHLVLSRDGEFVFASANVSGHVSKVRTTDLVAALTSANGRRIGGPRWTDTSVGVGARTVDITHDGRFLFVAVNKTSELVAVHADSMQVVSRVKVDPYAVGLAIAPDDRTVVLTSQGRSGQGGGNAVNFIRVDIQGNDRGLK